MVDFESEILHAADIKKLTATNRLVLSSIPLLVAHSINSTDAVTLKSALTIAKHLRAASDDLVLVASDQRLLRSAQAEGLVTFNPETQNQATLTALVGP